MILIPKTGKDEECGACGTRVDCVVQVTERGLYPDIYGVVCKDCLKQALQLLEGHKSEKESTAKPHGV